MSRLVRKMFRKITLSRVLVGLYDQIAPAISLGDRGEREAERLLLRQGMIIVARGYEDKFGEVDLIAVDDDWIVFVEVKTRTSDYAGLPAEAVDKRKQQHLTQTAKGYLKWNRLTDCRARFDVVAITWPELSKPPEIIHYQNAFEPAGNFQMF